MGVSKKNTKITKVLDSQTKLNRRNFSAKEMSSYVRERNLFSVATAKTMMQRMADIS